MKKKSFYPPFARFCSTAFFRSHPIVFSIFIAISTAPVFPQEIGFPFLRNYSPKEYNNSSQVWSAFQDDRGLMYFGMTGGGGIVEYDGKTWRVIDVPTTVFSFAQDTKKRIYTGAINDFGFLASGDRSKTEFVSLRHLIPDQNLKFKAVWFTVSNGDDIYFMSVDAIFKYRSGQQESVTTYLKHNGGIFTVIFPHENNVYALQQGRGLVRVGDDSLELVSDVFKNTPMRCVLPLSPDSLLMLTRQKGMYLYHFRDKATTPVRLSDTSFLKNNVLYTTALLHNGNIVVGSNNKGVQLLNRQGKRLQQWNTANHLPVNSVYHVYHSPENLLWFSTENGITRTEISTAWSYWNKTAGLFGTVTDILKFKGVLHVATMRGIYAINKDNIPEKIEGIDPSQCWKLFTYVTPAKENILLAGTANGMYQIDGGKARLIRPASHVTAFCVSSADPSRIIISSNPALISMKYDKGRWKEEGVFDGINDNLQESIEDANGELWIATYVQGIIRITPDRQNPLKPKKIRYYTMNDGLPSMRIANPYRHSGEIIFGTEKGIYKHNSETDRFEPYDKLNDFLPEKQRDILVIRTLSDGTILFLGGSHKGSTAGYLTPLSGGGFKWVTNMFRTLPRMELISAYLESDGILWIGGTEGLFRYDPAADVKDYEKDFHTLIRSVSLKGDSIISYGDTGNPVSIEHNDNDISFAYAAPFFTDEEKTLFRHQLVGYDDQWSEWSMNASAVYTNMDEGNYTFRAKAKNLYDRESQTAEFSFRVLPPWHRTWWAYGSYIFLLGISIGTFDRWNKRRLRRNYDKENETEQLRQKQLSRALIDRQEKERQRISREMHDSLGQELLILKHRLQLNQRTVGLSEELKSAFEEHSLAASDILMQLRQISHDLRPPELDRLGITETIRAILRRVRETKQMEILGEVDEIDGFFQKDDEINFIRILQESLNNIMKHSGASRASVTIIVTENILRFTVSDNGKGMETANNQSSGLGMNDMTDRVQLLGGSMEIHSSSGNGTTLKFYFPKREHHG